MKFKIGNKVKVKNCWSLITSHNGYFSGKEGVIESYQSGIGYSVKLNIPVIIPPFYKSQHEVIEYYVIGRANAFTLL